MAARFTASLILALTCGLAVASTGCSESNDPDGGGLSLTLTTDRSAYAPGQTVAVSLTNNSDQAVGYNLCDYRLESQQGAEWVRKDDPERFCDRTLVTLAAHASASGSIPLPTSLEAGTYRLRYSGIVTNFQAPETDLATAVSSSFVLSTAP